MTKLAAFTLSISIVTIVLGALINWIFIVIGVFGLVIFEILSAYIYEWYVEQRDEKY